MCCLIFLEGNTLCIRGISPISAQMHKIPEYCSLYMWIWPLHEPGLCVNLLAFFVFYHIIITFTELKFCPWITKGIFSHICDSSFQPSKKLLLLCSFIYDRACVLCTYPAYPSTIHTSVCISVMTIHMQPMHSSPKFTTTSTDRDAGTIGISVASI